MLQTNPFRTAPQVDKLEDLKKFIQSLEFLAVPYPFIDSRNIEKLSSEGKLSLSSYTELKDWKLRKQFSLAKGYFTEIISLMKILGIVEGRPLINSELEMPLGIDGPLVKNLVASKNIQTIQLTDLGHRLCSLLNTQTIQSLKEYDTYLFWLILTSRIRPVWQRLMESSNTFSNLDISKSILQIGEKDGITISTFLKWSNYFNLCTIDPDQSGKKLMEKGKVALKLLYATVLELNKNFISQDGYTVEELTKTISKNFKISPSIVNFYNILETIFEYNKKKNIIGSTTGRKGKSLPNYSRINILKIQSEIKLLPDFENVTDAKLNSFWEKIR